MHELLERLTWPLDVGADLSLYKAHPDPLQLLTQTLWAQLQTSMQDHSQWQILKMLLRHDEQSNTPSETTQKIAAATAQSVQRIAAVLSIVLERGGLHYGLTPIEIAYCVHAFGIGILCEHLHIPTRSLHQHSSLSLEMLFKGVRQPEHCLQRD